MTIKGEGASDPTLRADEASIREQITALRNPPNVVTVAEARLTPAQIAAALNAVTNPGREVQR